MTGFINLKEKPNNRISKQLGNKWNKNNDIKQYIYIPIGHTLINWEAQVVKKMPQVTIKTDRYFIKVYLRKGKKIHVTSMHSL